MAKSLLRVLAGERLETPPVWLMRQAGRYLPEYREVRAKAGSFLDLCYQPALAVEVTLQPIRRFGFDAAILFSDILVVPDGLGQAVSFREGDGPRLDPVRTAADLKRLDPGRVLRHLAPVYETVAGIRAALPGDVALIGFAGAPWTVATYMIEGHGSRDFVEAKGWLYRDSGSFQALMDLLAIQPADLLNRIPRFVLMNWGVLWRIALEAPARTVTAGVAAREALPLPLSHLVLGHEERVERDLVHGALVGL